MDISGHGFWKSAESRSRDKLTVMLITSDALIRFKKGS